MILKQQTLAHSFLAGGTITEGAILMFDSDDDTVIVATAATDLLMAVALAGAGATERIEAQLGGIAWIKLGGTVARGENVTSGAAGVGVKLTAAATIQSCIGQAMASGVTGDMIPVHLGKWSAVTA